jgi:hypothetical protein
MIADFAVLSSNNVVLENIISDSTDDGGSPQYGIYFDRQTNPLVQNFTVRNYYSERNNNPSLATIRLLHDGVANLDGIWRLNDGTTDPPPFIDPTGSTDKTIVRLSNSPSVMTTHKFKATAGVQWVFERVGTRGEVFFGNPLYWVGGIVGNVTEFQLGRILVSGGGGIGGVPPSFQLARTGTPDMALGVATISGDFSSSALAGDVVLRANDITKRVWVGAGSEAAYLGVDASGILTHSPNGSIYRLTINNSGVLTTTIVP